jgi:hypothetical protein|tara:strand:- start:450 stop:788 length:339 start_codon:yes stop_codon:yes gene_type:complete
MLKSGEDIIADVEDIKSGTEVIGYYFDNPLIVKLFESEEPKVLNEEGSNKEYSSSVGVTFFPWIPLSSQTKVPCSADWVVTIVEPVEKLKTQYQEKLNVRRKDSENPVVING